ncbi:hypothetical protein IFM89_018990 [Coptis chinensis]|uniref:Uncharacterized protein n=1 Tax=Coptis chinensis TaxID=261450 RepID=A0A835IAK2_9MAGN|nr:hypothetical protein IFM89_018990 [Coptis chinensis]
MGLGETWQDVLGLSLEPRTSFLDMMDDNNLKGRHKVVNWNFGKLAFLEGSFQCLTSNQSCDEVEPGRGLINNGYINAEGLAKFIKKFVSGLSAYGLLRPPPIYKLELNTFENVLRSLVSPMALLNGVGWNPEKSLTPKIKVLQDHGVPEPNISNLFFYGFRGFTLDNTRFKGTVKDVLGRGFDPSRTMFTYALCVLSGMSKAKKRKKFGVFRSFGWADDQIHLAFRNQPTCLDISEEKLRTGLNFFMNIKSWEAAQLAKAPNVLGLSMKKRVIPRLTVIEFLVSKSLIKKDVRIVSSLLISDAKFMEKFVAKYGDKVPELIKLYHGEV